MTQTNYAGLARNSDGLRKVGCDTAMTAGSLDVEL